MISDALLQSDVKNCVICNKETGIVHALYEVHICSTDCLVQMDKKYDEYVDKCEENEIAFYKRKRALVEYLNSEIKTARNKILEIQQEINYMESLREDAIWNL